MYHILGNEFESICKHYEYDEGYAMIRVHACVHIPTCVLVVPNRVLGPAYIIHTRQASATPHGTPPHVSDPHYRAQTTNEGCALPKMNNINGAVLS